jgi:hypothetical protein
LNTAVAAAVEWPDALTTASGGAVLLAVLSVLWPGFSPAVAPLCALALLAGLQRTAARGGRPLRELPSFWVSGAAAGAGWFIFLAPLHVAPVLRALTLAGTTTALALRLTRIPAQVLP